MNIQCDRCKKIYGDFLDTTIKFRLIRLCQDPENHICYECATILRDFINENIPLQRKGETQIESEKDKKIMNDYYDSIEENDG